MRSSFAALSLIAGLVLAAARPAMAQAPSGPTVPIAVDLAKVPLGSWSEYTVDMGAMPPMKQRFALVGRGPRGHELELALEGGPMGAPGKVLVKVDLDPDQRKTERVKRVVMQIGQLEPMEMPTTGPGQQAANQFSTVDPKKYVDTQEIKVPAGTFKAKHYRDKMPDGSAIEYWVNEDVPPFGIVKMNANLPGGAAVMQLASRGKGAKPAITRPPRPFDQQKLMTELMSMASRSSGAGGPPPASPPPAKTKQK